MAPDDDGDEFFEALAGRRDRGGGPKALRDALAAQARTLREAEGASADALSDAERERMASLKEQLKAAGAFRPPAAPAPPANLVERLRAWLFGASSMRLVGVAAAIAVASVLVLKLRPSDDESNVMRGGAAPSIVVADPAARAKELEASLSAAGAAVVASPINEREWALAVDVPDASKLAAVQKLLRDAGFALHGPPPYELSVRASK